jgi:hypothetical protein
MGKKSAQFFIAFFLALFDQGDKPRRALIVTLQDFVC